MRAALPVLSVVAALAFAGCGSSGDKSTTTAASSANACAAAVASARVPSVSSFPAAKNQGLKALVGNLAPGPVIATSTSVFEAKKTNRVAFAAFDVAKKQVCGAQIAVYLLDGKLKNARGPYVAHVESLDVDAQYRSQQTASDLNSNNAIYVADVPIPRAGKFVIAGVAKLGGKTLATSQFAVTAGAKGGPPDVGDLAPKVKTLTGDDVAGVLSKIDTRVPPLPQLHEVSAAKVIGKQPLVLLFATPQLCASRVCGPVDDVLFQVSADPRNSGVRFIHQEIYRDNDPNKGLQAPVEAYGLRTEPWAFVIDRHGRISDRIEGAFSVKELEAAVARIR